MKKLLVRDLTLRDGQQSQFATRMSQKQVDRILEMYRRAQFYAMEVWWSSSGFNYEISERGSMGPA